ncbi:hypothetical protein TrVE_jg12184 [Triparma verrucosa]|uniref:Uncharacterized protein n=1 Tax=Triparma verrucosa TaxID=1606542 RepID=A0A9W7BNP9_9STRA|nr:hypothetical protein TrVE_jg12184 [Triparma verrucosa]
MSSEPTAPVSNPISLRTIRERALTKEESESKTPEDLADFLFEKTVLHLAYSHLTGEITSLDPFSNLTELYLQGNSLTSISDGLELLVNLKLLFLRCNKISVVEGIQGLRRLEVLDLAQNCIEDVSKYGKDVIPSQSLQVLDLAGNPCVENEGHRRMAVSTLPMLTILDGEMVKREDGENEATRMHVRVPLLEDDGSDAGFLELFFDKDSDLWSLADKFCKVNEIEGEVSRRELVMMMKKEARRVWGVVVKDKGETGKKLREALKDDILEERKEDEHEREVRVNTERAFHAVEDFMDEMSIIEKENGLMFKDKTQEMVTKSEERREEEKGVSAEAMAEAKQLLKAKVEKIKKEKMEEKRRKKEALQRADEMRRQGADLPPLPEAEKNDLVRDEGKYEEEEEVEEEKGGEEKVEETKLDDVVKIGAVGVGHTGKTRNKTKQKVYEDDIGVGGDESDDSRENMFFDDNSLLLINRK